jgi:hemerythrin-like metal-binding protein
MQNNLFIVWNDTNKTGIPIIDEQHRGIISNINSLHYFMQLGHGEEILKPTLIVLNQYVGIHFRTEIALLVKANYPDLELHKGLHKSLSEKTKKYGVEITKDKDPKKILYFLKDWWLDHINKEDKKYIPFIKKLQS